MPRTHEADPDTNQGEITQDIVFSEIAAGDNPDFQVELTNVGSDGITLDGYQLRSSSGATQQVPGGLLQPGDHLAITPSFPVADGHRLSLLRPGTEILADASRTERAWLHDFADDEVQISSDLYEVLCSFRHLRPSA